MCNASLDALMCPLQIINDIEPLLLSLHGVNPCYIYYPSKVKNYTINHKSETTQLKEKKCIKITYFYTFLQIFGSKFKISIATEIQSIFLFLANWYFWEGEILE